MGLRLALSILTAAPMGQPRAQPRDVSRAMTAAPAVGLIIGVAAASVLALVQLAPHTDVLAAALAVAAVAASSRLLHLDGLADTADAIGCKGDRADALRVMRAPEIGAFGAVALALILIIDVAALTVVAGEHRGAACVVVASVASRLTISICCRRGLATADGSRLGAWVAGTVGPAALAVATVVVIAIAVGLGATWSSSPMHGGVQSGISAVIAIGVGEVARIAGSQRVGGLTGDVIGAAVECSFAAACVSFAVTGGLL